MLDHILQSNTYKQEYIINKSNEERDVISTSRCACLACNISSDKCSMQIVNRITNR